MVLWWEFASCSENCRYYHGAAADLPSRTKGLQKARARTEVCIGVAQTSWSQQIRAAKQRAGKEQRQSGGKKEKDWQKCKFTEWAYLESKSDGRRMRSEGAVQCLCVPPQIPTVGQLFLFTEPFLHHTSVSQLLTAYKAGTLLFHVPLKGVYLEIK